MNTTSTPRVILGFLAAVVVTVVWGSVVQTQYNLAALAGIGADIGPGTNLRATFTDIFSGFFPTYGGYVVLPALLVAFSLPGWWSGAPEPRFHGSHLPEDWRSWLAYRSSIGCLRWRC